MFGARLGTMGRAKQHDVRADPAWLRRGVIGIAVLFLTIFWVSGLFRTESRARPSTVP